MDPPEPELELEQEKPRHSTVSGPESTNTSALIRVDNNALVAPAALLHVVHAILPLYAVLLRLAQFAFWRRQA